jgi:D-alanyl-D-alanine carboxypeptidase
MVAIAQLAQQGRLHVSDSVGALLPDNPVPAARGVTIDQLIHHRSGLGDIFGDRYDKADHARLRDLKDFLPLFADQPLEFAPGTRQRYSNAGFVLLGLIIERVSGQEYHDYIRDHIYRPAGMTRTDSYELERRTPDLATGYTRRLDDDGRRNGDHSKPAEGPLRENTPTLPARASSAGGGYSTTDDLLRFSKAMRDHQLVDAGWTDWVMGGQVPAAATVASNHAHGAWGIAGGAPGTNSVVEMDFEHGVVLVVLANMDPPIAELMSRTIRQWIARTDFGTGASRVSK